MNKSYNLKFEQVIENMYKYPLGTLIESQKGDLYRLEQVTDDKRKFTRMLRTKTRFMIYENVKMMFRIVNLDKEIDKENRKSIEKIKSLYGISYNDKIDNNFNILFRKINEIIDLVNLLNIDIKELKEPKKININFSDINTDKIIKDIRKQFDYCENCGDLLTEENKYMDGMCMECKYDLERVEINE